MERLNAKAVHIDTVVLSHAYRPAELPLPDELVKKGFEINHKHRESSGNIINARFRPLGKRDHEPRITITKSDHGYSGIQVEVSIAKLLDGNGLGEQTDEDIECALDAIENCTWQRTGVTFDARTAKVKRLDANADFPVGEHRIQSYLKSMNCRSSRMIQGTVGTTTKQFHNKSRTLIAYGKRAEIESHSKGDYLTRLDAQMATGLLRVESRLRGAPISRLAKKLRVAADAGHLLTMSIAHQIVASALNELGLDLPKFSMQARDQRLIERFGGDAPTMLGILEWRTRYGEKSLKSLFSQSTFYRLRGKLLEAELLLTESAEELPALAITADAYNNSTSLSDLGIEADAKVA